MQIDDLLKEEIKRSFEFFHDYSNQEEGSRGYGLVVDRTNDVERSSIASVGFKLTVYVIGVERGYITYSDARNHILGTLKTLYYNVDHYKGFFAHFVDIKTGKRQKGCEFSTIDTALCLEGILTCISYFTDAEIKDLGEKIIKRVNYKDFIFTKEGKKVLYMSYNPDKGGAYRPDDNEDGYIWHWDHTAEQLMMYQHLALDDSISDELLQEVYNGFRRDKETVEGKEVIYSPGGSIFIYQFSTAWFDYQKYLDQNKFDWFTNAKTLIKANYDYCVSENSDPTLAPHNWGLAAGDTPDGYRVYGGPPKENMAEFVQDFNGTTQQYAILASIPFIPEIVKDSIAKLYELHPESFTKYGFTDGMNFRTDPPWFCPNCLGIDKGISTIMLDNYYYGTTWKYYQQNELVQKAIKRLGFIEKV